MKKTRLLDAMIDQHDAMYCSITLHGGKMLAGATLYALDALSKWQYNEFDGKRIAKWLKDLLLKDAKVQVGREYSPVIYVHVPHAGDSKAAADKELALAQGIMTQGKKLKADETSTERRTQLPEGKFSEIVVRLWWD